MKIKDSVEPVTGEVTLTLRYIHAVKKDGSLDSSHCAECEDEFSKLIGTKVTTRYSINTETLIMEATSTFSPSKLEPLEISVSLNALGLSGRYAFGSFRPPNFPAAYAVLFSIDLQFNDPTSTFVLFGPKGTDFNCVVSSSDDVVNSPEKEKFKVE